MCTACVRQGCATGLIAFVSLVPCPWCMFTGPDPGMEGIRKRRRGVCRRAALGTAHCHQRSRAPRRHCGNIRPDHADAGRRRRSAMLCVLLFRHKIALREIIVGM